MQFNREKKVSCYSDLEQARVVLCATEILSCPSCCAGCADQVGYHSSHVSRQTCRQLPVAESNRHTAAGGESALPCGPAKPAKYFCSTQYGLLHKLASRKVGLPLLFLDQVRFSTRSHRKHCEWRVAKYALCIGKTKHKVQSRQDKNIFNNVGLPFCLFVNSSVLP